MNDEPQHKHRKYYILALFAVFIAILGVILPETEFTPKQYINASNITVVGAASTSGSLQNISDINGGFFNISEGNAQPFYAVVNFTNITNFSFVEVKSKYFSTSGTPSTHIVDVEIFCTTDNEYEDIFFLENAGEWRYFTRHFPDSMHFIDAQGNVSIKFNHTANGNTNHRLYIDTVRLITLSQYEQSTVYLTQYFNTTTTGGGGGVSFNGNPVNLNGTNLFNGTISNYSTLNYTNSSLNNKVNKSGDLMTGQLDIFGLLNQTSFNDSQQPLLKTFYNSSYTHLENEPCTDFGTGNCPLILHELGSNLSNVTIKHRFNPVNNNYGILVNVNITNVTNLQYPTKTGWGFFARPNNDDFYVGRFTPGLAEFTIRVISNTTFAVSQQNTTVLNISVSKNISLPGIPGASAASTGAAYLCFNYSRKEAYVGSPGC